MFFEGNFIGFQNIKLEGELTKAEGLSMKCSRAIKEFEFSKTTETGWVGSVLMHKVS